MERRIKETAMRPKEGDTFIGPDGEEYTVKKIVSETAVVFESKDGTKHSYIGFVTLESLYRKKEDEE